MNSDKVWVTKRGKTSTARHLRFATRGGIRVARQGKWRCNVWGSRGVVVSVLRSKQGNVDSRETLVTSES
ncbi:hypothetical protein L484_000126 [Morus notabilis]|uniref:Uncharacterized protein n=1 Tax=Morus notabilis TaxID=981085 RepID=W9T1C7_9ROSA|nr:hypothetical protein L484_008957 [Morus notabilis]EXC35795.1 hypothetical protein L484_000126 [Morus notabilis]